MIYGDWLLLLLLLWFPILFGSQFPTPHDTLRGESITKTVDVIASICQVLMVMSLCIFIHQDRKKISITRFIITTIICCVLYFLCWVFYYVGVTNAIVILGLTIFPCLTFLFFAIDRKNMLAVIPISIFMVCHLIYGMVNYII